MSCAYEIKEIICEVAPHVMQLDFKIYSDVKNNSKTDVFMVSVRKTCTSAA